MSRASCILPLSLLPTVDVQLPAHGPHDGHADTGQFSTVRLYENNHHPPAVADFGQQPRGRRWSRWGRTRTIHRRWWRPRHRHEEGNQHEQRGGGDFGPPRWRRRPARFLDPGQPAEEQNSNTRGPPEPAPPQPRRVHGFQRVLAAHGHRLPLDLVAAASRPGTATNAAFNQQLQSAPQHQYLIANAPEQRRLHELDDHSDGSEE
uniref:(northern house mosquito) hypothetical protein n=1 Tax=Culex pipiens TaxID=7175 RepID=A0A8D8I9E7_CULPI